MAGTRRTIGWVGGAFLLAVTLWSIYVLLLRISDAGPEFAAKRYLIPLLSITLIILVLALAGLLIRNLVRLTLDRRRGVPGARLRSKLVAFLLGFVLIPALVMVYGSSAIIKKSVEALIRTPVEDITRVSGDIVEEWNTFLLDTCVRDAAELADVYAISAGDREARRRLLSAWRERRGATYVAAALGEGPPVVVVDPALAHAESEVDSIVALAEAVVEDGRRAPASRIEDLGFGIVMQAAVPLASPSGAIGAVSVGRLHAKGAASKLRFLASQGELYRQFRLEARELLRLYLILIALVFLVTLFLATWIGFYVGRRITEPIQQVAAASREISAGNLGVRVRSAIGDEVGVLVDSFNDMAAQLQESREVINRSNVDLRRSNRALEERRRYIETLVANLSTGVVSLDPTGFISTSNPAVETILGVPLAQGQRFASLASDERLAPLVSLVEGARASRRDELRREVTLSIRGGSTVLSVQVSALVGGRGETLGTLVMLEDLTDLVRAQRAAAWREVARRIAHEIKNPLTPIQLAAQRLRKKFAARSPDLERILPEATDSIEREVAGLKHLVDEFSRYARMPEVSPTEVRIEEMVESVRALYEGHADVRWRVDIAPEVGVVRMDVGQMRRVLINLVDNAIAAMEGRGTIGVTVRRERSGASVRIEVEDSGPGIADSDLERLFVPYFSTKRSGTGLGLAIVHRVVTEHRGTIRVENNEPHGARFVMEIPA